MIEERQFSHASVVRLLLLILSAVALRAQTACGPVGLSLSSDYQFAIGTSGGGSAYTWTLNGQTIAQGAVTQLSLFHYDTSLASTSGIAPSQSAGTSVVPGKFGSAVAIADGGTLSYPAQGNLSFVDGTIEMWVSPQFDGTNPVYIKTPPILFAYELASSQGLTMAVANVNNSPYIYGGAAGAYAGYSPMSSIVGWKAGEWHHVAFSYSTRQSRIRIYLDGILLGENDQTIQFASDRPPNFMVGSDFPGNANAFLIDELRITNDEKLPAEIAGDANRSGPFADNEVYLSLAGVAPGQIAYTVSGCGTASLAYTGIPITNFSPPSGLLPPGSASVPVSFQTVLPTVCRYSVGSNQAFASMQPLDTGPPVTAHQGSINGISLDTRVLNSVYVRCASDQNYVQSLVYRTVAAPGGAFPRIGSIWGGNYIDQNKPDQAKKISSILGPTAWAPPMQARSGR